MPTRTKLFQSNRSQALRLPRDVAFPAEVQDVLVLKQGVNRLIVPAGSAWDDFFDALGIDLPDRQQPAMQQRDDF